MTHVKVDALQKNFHHQPYANNTYAEYLMQLPRLVSFIALVKASLPETALNSKKPQVPTDVAKTLRVVCKDKKVTLLLKTRSISEGFHHKCLAVKRICIS